MIETEKFAEYPALTEAARRWSKPAADLVALCVAIQQIPAPTGEEAARAAWVAERMRKSGLQEMVYDPVTDNVYGRWPGAQSGPALLISAHTDTVFGIDTDLSVRYEPHKNRVYGPGIGDNSMGVAALLELLAVMPLLPPPPVDIWFAANSQEEGLGDLRGMRALVDALEDRIGASVVLEGMGFGRVVHRALGSRRYRISVTATGGHSWSDFGASSALHVLAQLAADLTRIRSPETPRTTFNIGRMEGGTSVNTIAQHAWLELDLRSEEPETLAWIIDQVMEIVARYRRPMWQHRGVTVETEVIGDRPPGSIPADHPLVVASEHALKAVGYAHDADLRISSTDANIPLSRGIPAICVGITDGSNAHRLQEWISTEPLQRGMSHLLLLSWQVAEWLATGESSSVS
ncbi:MAG: M20/M25/M40 family metallo-hydrolase [Caldilineaceae bacterium]|nr:M20/M25/M40 family metallo-hydrolase [Caldilineaceae bacterium]